MLNPSQSVGKSALVPDDLAMPALRQALGLYVGNGSAGQIRRYTYKQLARGTGISVERLQGFVAADEPRQPKLTDLLSLAAFLGPEFTSDLLKLTGQGAFALPSPDDDRPLKEMVPEAAEDHAELTRQALEGGNVTALRTLAHRGIARNKSILAKVNAGQPDLFERVA